MGRKNKNSERENLIKKELELFKNIDFSFMKKLYINSFVDDEENLNLISPLKYFEKKDFSNKKIEEISFAGKQILVDNAFSVIIMAGGMGSRLGLECPKGMLQFKKGDMEFCLFELFINQIKDANKKYGCSIPVYIMCNSYNVEHIKNFFKENKYFGYLKKNINFFIQGNLPILDFDGNLVLKNEENLLLGPNGNGDIYDAFNKSGFLKELKGKKVQWIFVCSIDNPLVKLVDPFFLGLTVEKGYQLASKTIFKEDAFSKNAVFCKKNNKPYILNYKDITEELSNMKDQNGKFLYRDINIVNHLISLELFEDFSKINLKYHRARKANKYINVKGKLVSNDELNSFKFEKFIFDAFYNTNDMLLYRVLKKEEFFPIKNTKDFESYLEFIKK